MDVLQIVLAAVPIVALVLALGVFRLPAHWAGLATAALAAVLAVFAWRQPAALVASAAAEGAAIALWPIMLVVVAAIFSYNVAQRTGALEQIKTMLTRISPDRRLQVLILAWGFGGFLEAVAGYGTAVAIPAGILAALGFEPLFAAVVCLVANTVPTAFGSLGIPVSTLAQITGLDPGVLSLTVAWQLAPFIALVPFALVMMTGRLREDGTVARGFGAVRGVGGIALAAGLAFALPQLAAAAWLGPELPALAGSLCSLAVTVWLAGRKRAKAAGRDAPAAGPAVAPAAAFKAWLPYLLILAFVLATSPLLPGVHRWLEGASSRIAIYAGPDAAPTLFKWVLTPGVLILAAALLGGWAQGLRPRQAGAAMLATLDKLKGSALTVVAILAMAKIMDHSGMVSTLAGFLARAAGPVYPLLAGMMGTLGTFVTGSDTSSNILFGKLQVGVAQQTGASAYWLAAANTVGATAGKMVSPQSIAVATAATGLVGREGAILGKTALFCIGYVAVLGALVWALSAWIRI